MKRTLIIGLTFFTFTLSACGSSEWQAERELGKEAIEEGDFQAAVDHYEKAVELMPKHQALKEELEYAVVERDEENARLEEERKKNEEEEKKAAENERLKKEREEGRVKAEKFARELIELSEGSVVNVRPTYGDDWIAVYVELDNSVHLLSSEEKRYIVESMGPLIEHGIVESGATDHSEIHFIDQNGNTIATPKVFGGWKMKD